MRLRWLGWHGWHWCLAFCLGILSPFLRASTPAARPADLLLVVGAPGEKQYESEFAETARTWIEACARAGKAHLLVDSAAASTNQLVQLEQALEKLRGGDEVLWIVLVGHGTFDGKETKFNLAGPDLSAGEMKRRLETLQRPLVVINTSASSAPFINELSGPNRVVIAATKSGWEENYAHFGKFLAKAIADPAGDIDKDGQVSVLEAFLTASRQVEEFYEGEKRLATEHSLLDDNGDGKGSPSTFFQGARPAKKSSDGALVDGFRAHQIYFLPNEFEAQLPAAVRRRRNDLELELETARLAKAGLSEEQYLKKIEPILIELSRLYQSVQTKDASTPQVSPPPPAPAAPAAP